MDFCYADQENKGAIYIIAERRRQHSIAGVKIFYQRLLARSENSLLVEGNINPIAAFSSVADTLHRYIHPPAIHHHFIV